MYFLRWLRFLQARPQPELFLERAMVALRTLVAMLMLCCSAMAFQAAPLRSSAPSRAAASSISVRHYPACTSAVAAARPQTCRPVGRLACLEPAGCTDVRLIMPTCLPLLSVRAVVLDGGLREVPGVSSCTSKVERPACAEGSWLDASACAED